MKKIMKTLVLTSMLCGAFCLGNRVTAQAEEPEVCTVQELDSVADLQKMGAGWTSHVQDLPENSDEWAATSYVQFTLEEDSWVYIKGNYSLANHDGGQTHVNFYYDAAYSNLLAEYGWGYWEYYSDIEKILPKGTYYATVQTKQANYDVYTEVEGVSYMNVNGDNYECLVIHSRYVCRLCITRVNIFQIRVEV